jgi:CheY-like chemotaxis protein
MEFHQFCVTMPRILSVSYDDPVLRTRRMLLESGGYQVVSSLDLSESLEYCKRGTFHLFLLGHSIPHLDKLQLVTTFRQQCPAPIVSLRRNQGEQLVDGADYHVEPDPELLLMLVRRIFSSRTSSD